MEAAPTFARHIKEEALMIVLQQQADAKRRWTLFSKMLCTGLLKLPKQTIIEFWTKEATENNMSIAISTNTDHPQLCPWSIVEQHLKTSWKRKLSEWQKPIDRGSMPMEVDDILINLCLQAFQTRNSKSISTNITLDSRQRYWLHTRSQQINATAETLRGSRYNEPHGKYEITLTFSAGWTWPTTPGDITSTSNTERKREERLARMEAWRTSCDECGKVLDAYEALYYWGGLGPLCEDCVDADEELEGLKWEAKAEFWH